MKSYEKPSIEFECFELNAAIASGCNNVVSIGPAGGGYDVCDEYKEEEFMLFSVPHEPPASQNFWEESCSCYLSAGVETVFTS